VLLIINYVKCLEFDKQLKHAGAGFQTVSLFKFPYTPKFFQTPPRFTMLPLNWVW